MIFRYLQSLKITKLYKTEWCLNQKIGTQWVLVSAAVEWNLL